MNFLNAVSYTHLAEVNRNQVDANQQTLLIEAYFGLRLGQSVVDVKTEVYNSLTVSYTHLIRHGQPISIVNLKSNTMKNTVQI